MHNPVPISREGFLQSKDLQVKTSSVIVGSKESPLQDATDFNEPEAISSTSPSASSTPSCRSAEWEQLSATGTDQSTISTEFEILKGYNRVPIYERRAQWLADQQARREQKLQSNSSGADYSRPGPFQPNSQLPFPITAQFLRYYGGSNGKSWRSPQSDDSQRTIVAPINHAHTPATTSSYLSTPASLPSSPEGAPEIPSFSQRRKLIEEKQSRPSPPSRKTSGIPSFTSLFESRWDWDRSPKPRNSDYSPAIPKEISTSSSPCLGLRPKKKPKSIPSLGCCDKTRPRLGSIFGHRRRAFFALVITGFSLTIFFILATMYNSSTANNFSSLHYVSHSTASLYTRTPYVDFPALMSIESSFERIVESATSGSNLARLLKQGEISVSDLGTVIKHSDLSCKRALAEQLDHFANGAKEGVIALQFFESRVGEVLDRVLGANEDFLGEFTSQLKSQKHLRYTSVPFVSRIIESPYTRVRLSENFDRAVRLLNSNLEELISSGKRIIKSLEYLSQQHNPIYEAIVREFVSLERRDESVWAKIGWESSRAGIERRMRVRESRQLLALVGGYEEKARGYVESILLELESMMSGLETLQKRVSDLLSFSTGIRENDATEIPLGRQLEAVEHAVASTLHKRVQRTRRACSMGVIIDRRAKNGTGSYWGIFTPTRTSET